MKKRIAKGITSWKRITYLVIFHIMLIFSLILVNLFLTRIIFQLEWNHKPARTQTVSLVQLIVCIANKNNILNRTTLNIIEKYQWSNIGS